VGGAGQATKSAGAARIGDDSAGGRSRLLWSAERGNRAETSLKAVLTESVSPR